MKFIIGNYIISLELSKALLFLFQIGFPYKSFMKVEIIIMQIHYSSKEI